MHLHMLRKCGKMQTEVLSKVCDNDAQSGESRPSMRKRALLPVSTRILNTLSCCTHQTFGSNCWRLWVRIPLNEDIVFIHVHTQHVCMLFFYDGKDEQKNVRFSAHALHIRACVCVHCLRYIYANLLAPIDCEFASRVMERVEKKTRALWIGLKTVSQTDRTKGGGETTSRKMNECMNIYWVR